MTVRANGGNPLQNPDTEKSKGKQVRVKLQRRWGGEEEEVEELGMIE